MDHPLTIGRIDPIISDGEPGLGMARSKKGWAATDEYDVGSLVQKIRPFVSAAPSRP
jgi:hypothetical protein